MGLLPAAQAREEQCRLSARHAAETLFELRAAAGAGVGRNGGARGDVREEAAHLCNGGDEGEMVGMVVTVIVVLSLLMMSRGLVFVLKRGDDDGSPHLEGERPRLGALVLLFVPIVPIRVILLPSAHRQEGTRDHL